MKKVVFFFMLLILPMIITIQTKTIKADTPEISEPSDLYGLSALLMDAKTGEVLFEKNGNEPAAIASTTKILTCLVALEHGNPDDVVTISANAAGQPDVQMNVKENEQYRLGDLLKGMMLESFNDVSVAVAEHIAGTEDAFADLMNEKAVSLGCKNSHFITPNGLDVKGQELVNYSTAEDLARILSAAIQNKEFLEITQTVQWEITELNQKRVVNAQNRNRFLLEYDGMLSGKTGYTGKAGYCYAGAAEKDDRILVAVTLGSGWPPNKNYKWSDIRELLDYGFENFHYKEPDYLGVKIPNSIPLTDGIDAAGNPKLNVGVSVPKPEKILLRDDETYYAKIYLLKKADAPVTKEDVLGRIEIYRNEKLVEKKWIQSIDDVEKVTFRNKIYQILRYFFDKIIGNLLKLEKVYAIIS